MIAYNKKWLDNLLVHEEMDDAYQHDLISKDELSAVTKQYPARFYTPNIFIRIGLFILTGVIAGFSMGLIALLMLSGIKENNFGVLLIFFGMLAYVALELMVRQKHHYKSGVDDALLWASGACIIGGINLMGNISETGNALLILLFTLYFFMRFSNAFMGVITALSLLATLFLLYSKLGNIAKATTPFVIMLTAAGIYFVAESLYKKTNFRHYKQGLTFIKITALICLYGAVNYFIVREASIALFNLELKENESIPLGWLFWSFTFIIPLAYILIGIKKKDVLFLRVGLLLVGSIVFTVRYYHSVLPLETAMTLGGLLLIGIAYGLIQYLRQPKHGFTYAAIAGKQSPGKLNAEALVIAETFNTSQAADNNTGFGGGSFGGGGGSGEF